MKYLKNILLIIAISLTNNSFGCDCKDLGPLDSLRQISYVESELVFLGELVEYDTTNFTYSFRIIEQFKGEQRESIIKGKYFDSCSEFPHDNGMWIVYADLREGLIDINQCLASRSKANPICINCYELPRPLSTASTEKDKENFENEINRLKTKAQEDWENEIQLLRQMKE